MNATQIANLRDFITEHQEMQFIDMIYEFAGYHQYWKQRFTNDVLSKINKHYRYCGFICPDHYMQEEGCGCALETLRPCANCYSYGYCTSQHEDHVQWGPVSFDHLVQMQCHSTIIKCPYVPTETFMFIYNLKNKNKFYYTRKFANIRNDLPVELATKRIQYAERNGEGYPNELWEMRYLLEDRKSNFWWWRR